jgi:hypothetical protein
VYRHRLFEQTFKPTNTKMMNNGKMAPEQPGNEDFKRIFQEQMRMIVRDGILSMIAQEVTDLCGESHRPAPGIYSRAGSEKVTIKTTSGKEPILKRRVRATHPDGTEHEVRLNTYAEVRRCKGMFDEVLQAMCHGASSAGVGKMSGTSKSSVSEAWKVRSGELLEQFRARDLSRIDVLTIMMDGVFLGPERCVLVALAIDTEGYKHMLDFEEGSSESAEVVTG